MSKPTYLSIGASSDIRRELTRLLSPEYRIGAHCRCKAAVLSDLQHQGDLSILEADLTSDPGVSELIAGIEARSVCPDAIVFLAAPPLKISKSGYMTRALPHDHLEMHLHSPIAVTGGPTPEGKAWQESGGAKSRHPPFAYPIKEVERCCRHWA